jgi:hypothetical protein
MCKTLVRRVSIGHLRIHDRSSEDPPVHISAKQDMRNEIKFFFQCGGVWSGIVLCKRSVLCAFATFRTPTMHRLDVCEKQCNAPECTDRYISVPVNAQSVARTNTPRKTHCNYIPISIQPGVHKRESDLVLEKLRIAAIPKSGDFHKSEL